MLQSPLTKTKEKTLKLYSSLMIIQNEDEKKKLFVFHLKPQFVSFISCLLVKSLLIFFLFIFVFVLIMLNTKEIAGRFYLTKILKTTIVLFGLLAKAILSILLTFLKFLFFPFSFFFQFNNKNHV